MDTEIDEEIDRYTEKDREVDIYKAVKADLKAVVCIAMQISG